MESFLSIIARLSTYCLIFCATILIATFLDSLRKTNLDTQEILKGNSAAGFRRFGLYLGLGIALFGTFIPKAEPCAQSIFFLTLNGGVSALFIIISRVLTEIILGCGNDWHINAENTAVGIVEAGMYITMGIILNGNFNYEISFPSEKPLPCILSVLFTSAFVFISSQLILYISIYFHHGINTYDMRKEIKKGNDAAALALSGILISLGIIFRAAIAASYPDWKCRGLALALSVIYGLPLLLIFRKLINWIVFPGKNLEDLISEKANIAATAVAQAMLISMALILSTLI